MINRHFALISALYLINSCQPASRADDLPGPPTPGKAQIETGIKGTALPFSQGINYIATAAAVIKQEAELIIGEATRQDSVVVRGPNVLPNGVVIPPVGGPGGVMQIGELPMRKRKLDGWVKDLGHNVEALQGYVDGLILPENETQSAAAAYATLRAASATAQEHLSMLKELADQRIPPNKKVGRQALAIYDAMSEIEKQQRFLSTLHAGKADQP